MNEINRPKPDGENQIDWGKASADYSKFRKGYPQNFYQLLRTFDIGKKNQKILDLASGTGEIAVNLAKSGAQVVGIDISEDQVVAARVNAKTLDLAVEFKAISAEEIDFNENSFEVIVSSCSWNYFVKKIVLPKLKKILRPKGKLLISYLVWLPDEDDIARETEKLVLSYNPNWKGAGFNGKPKHQKRLSITTQKHTTNPTD
ncbi:MAG: class I SAM-dependent methyltransferase [Candidatus Scalindua sp.]